MKCSKYILLSFLAVFGSVSLSHASGTWIPLAHPPPSSAGHFLLLSDGTVMAQANPYANGYSQNWYRLVPDSHGSYVNGTWTNMPSMNYTRLDFASVVLQDGRVFVAGGEYGTGQNNAEVYDPVNNTWTMTGGAPSGQGGFEDSGAILLADGNVLIAPVKPATSGGTVIYDTFHNTLGVGPTLYRGKDQDEATWVKLPDDSILTIDPFGTSSERYIPSSNTWVNDGDVPDSLYDPYGGETGAGLLLPNGKAIYFGGTTHTAIYSPSGSMSPGSWVAGPDFPNGQGMADGPAAMLVNGRILCVVAPAPYSVNGTNYVYNSPMSFYEYDYTANSFTQVNAPGGGTTFPSVLFSALLAELPDGSVLFGHRSSDFYVYRPDGAPLAAGKPNITGISTNSDGSLHLVGTLFNGLCQGASYGDDEQMDSNFPLVRFTDASGTVRYGRSHNWSRTSVMTGNAQLSTECNVPSGASVYDSIQVVANGIASDGVSLTVTTTNDSGPGSLRQAVSVFYPGSTIIFAASLSGQTIRLTSGELLVNKSMNINASALPAGITIDGNHSIRVFEVNGGSTLVLVGLTIANGYALGASGGGLVISDSASTVLATNCVFTGNTARGGDGLSMGSNSSGGPGGGGAGMGGGIFQSGGTLVLSNCKFLSNSAIGGNGGTGNGNSATSDSGAPGGGPNFGLGGAGFTSGGAGGFGGGGGGGGGGLIIFGGVRGGPGGPGGFGGGGGAGGAASLGNGNTGGPGGPGGAYGGAAGPGLAKDSGGGGGGAGLGGGLFLESGVATLVNCTFSGNLATNGVGGDGSAGGGSGSPGQGVGGAVFNYQGGIHPQNLAFSGNSASTALPDMDLSTTVANVNDSGPGSLRQAIYNVNAQPAGGAVSFAPGFAGQAILLTSGEIPISQSGGAVTLDASASDGLMVSGGGVSRVFNVASGASLTLDSVTITNGYSTEAGGGILNQGYLTLHRCSLLGNRSTFAGGGMRNLYTGLLVADNCTFALNSASQEGGAILNDGGAVLVLRQCTIASNTAASSAGGLDLFNGVIRLSGCIVAANSSPVGPDIQNASSSVTASYNLLRDGTGSSIANGVNGNQVGTTASPLEPHLGALANNGGPTLTMWLLAGSPAVAAGDPLFIGYGLTDQRGYARLAGARVDLGAVEAGLRTFYTFDNFSLTDLFGSSTLLYKGSPSGPWFNTDHRGQGSSAIALNDDVGGTAYGTNNYYQLLTAGDPTNSVRGLGLLSDFTISAWVWPRIEGGLKVVVGAAGAANSTLLIGLSGPNAIYRMGFITLTGGRNVPQGAWTHLACTYNSQDGQMALYVNGQLDTTALAVEDLFPNTNLLLGFSEAYPGSYFQGFVDEFAIFKSALSPSQIAALAGPPGIRADAIISAPVLSPGLTGGDCAWNVVEVYAHTNDPTAIPYDLAGAEYAAFTPGSGKSTNYSSGVINRWDPDAPPANSGPFIASAVPFGCNNLTPQGLLNGNDTYFVLAATTTLQIGVEDDYTFGFASDDGARLRLLGGVFASATPVSPGNVANPPQRGDTLMYPNPTANSTTLGVAHLKPGSYGLEFLMFQRDGAAYAEVFAAHGAKTALDSSFQLLSPNLFMPQPTLTLTRLSPTQLSVSWNPVLACDRLQSAPSVAGPWADVSGGTNGQVIGYDVGQRFYRVAH